MVFTVRDVWEENLFRPGLLTFVQGAAYLPDVERADAPTGVLEMRVIGSRRFGATSTSV